MAQTTLTHRLMTLLIQPKAVTIRRQTKPPFDRFHHATEQKINTSGAQIKPPFARPENTRDHQPPDTATATLHRKKQQHIRKTNYHKIASMARCIETKQSAHKKNTTPTKQKHIQSLITRTRYRLYPHTQHKSCAFRRKTKRNKSRPARNCFCFRTPLKKKKPVSQSVKSVASGNQNWFTDDLKLVYH